MSEQIDLRGLTCPEPVLRTKKLFDNPDIAFVQALVDDDVCVNNLKRLARSLKANIKVEDRSGHFAVTLSRNDNKAETSMAPTDHTHPHVVGSGVGKRANEVGTVVLLAKDHLGEGDAEFSRTLINLFLQTLFDAGHRPRALLLMNSGVKLMAKDSQALKVLNDFREAGVEVLACGLCVDFYGVKESVPKEQITNMFAIVEYLMAADRILQP
jgi:selenium metabolism protein YedF